MFWSMVLGIPMIVVWVFGTPLVGLFMLFRRRHSLNTPGVKRYFIVMYQGLKEKKFYWEFVNILRKIILLFLNVFLSQYSHAIKGGVAVIVIIILYRIQIKIKPFEHEHNND